MLTGSALSLLVVVSAAGADVDTPALKKARQAHAKAVGDADKRLTEWFDKAAEQVANQKLTAEQKVATLDVLKAERKRFEEKGLLPTSEPMWPHVVAHLAATQAAEAQLRKSYAPEIDKHLKAKKDDAAKDLLADLHAAAAPRVVAVWKQQHGNDPAVTLTFYSNGKAGGADGERTWTLQRDGTLVVRRSDPKAPGGAWVSTSKLARDGSGYGGTNQQTKAMVTGRYVTE